MPTGNRLLPLLMGLVVVMLGFVAIRSCSGDPQGVAVMQDVPLAPVPDADTPADTIKTLTANVAAHDLGSADPAPGRPTPAKMKTARCSRTARAWRKTSWPVCAANGARMSNPG